VKARREEMQWLERAGATKTSKEHKVCVSTRVLTADMQAAFRVCSLVGVLGRSERGIVWLTLDCVCGDIYKLAHRWGRWDEDETGEEAMASHDGMASDDVMDDEVFACIRRLARRTVVLDFDTGAAVVIFQHWTRLLTMLRSFVTTTDSQQIEQEEGTEGGRLHPRVEAIEPRVMDAEVRHTNDPLTSRLQYSCGLGHAMSIHASSMCAPRDRAGSVR
jgi:hypothetical protein